MQKKVTLVEGRQVSSVCKLKRQKARDIEQSARRKALHGISQVSVLYLDKRQGKRSSWQVARDRQDKDARGQGTSRKWHEARQAQRKAKQGKMCQVSSICKLKRQVARNIEQLARGKARHGVS